VSAIRPVERDDLPQVVDVYERAMRSGHPPAPPGLQAYFARTLLDQPWADPEIPSLVYEADDGRILGFIGSHVRRLDFDGRAMRMGCAGQLVSDPEQRRLAIGAKLLRKYLSGPQELTITDGGTEVVHEIWVRLGGHALHPHSVVWTRLLRPARAAGARRLERRDMGRLQRIAQPVFSLVDMPMGRLTRPREDPAVEAEELTARALIEHQSEVLGAARVRLDYDEGFLDWLFEEMAAVRTRGRLVRRLLRQDGRLLGWYIVYLKRDGLSEVISIAATKGAHGVVFDSLFAEAWKSGAAGLEGRLEPELYEPLSDRRCLLRYGTRALFHTRDPELAAAISLGQSALTRLDGEWWMGHHTEPFS
jgi:hypothetical protein